MVNCLRPMTKTMVSTSTINKNPGLREIWTIPCSNSLIVISDGQETTKMFICLKDFPFAVPTPNNAGYRFMKTVGAAIEMNVSDSQKRVFDIFELSRFHSPSFFLRLGST